MNDHEKDPIATLVRLAGRRPEVDAERTARVRAAVGNEWRASVRRKRWTRVAVAAAIAATIGGVMLTRPRTGPAAPVAPLVQTAAIRELTSPRDATTSVAWNGGTLRLDHETHLRFDGARTATLLRGAIYYANETPGVTVTIHTPFGDVRDVGTRFEIRLRDDEVRVRVRDGAVIVRDTTARAGTELVANRTSTTARTIATSGEEWAWIENAAPPIVLEGKSLDEVLQRIAIEKGLTLERSGSDQTLHGNVPLTIGEALDAATAAAGVTYRIEGDRLIVRGELMIRRALFLLLIANTLHAAPYRFAGRPLAEGLRELQSRGLRLIYSDDVVTNAMIVRTEPRATQPRKILDELLHEHALRAKGGPQSTLLIVRDERASRAAPVAEHAAMPPPQMPVTLEEIVVTPSRFTILRQEPESRQFLSREEVRRVPHLSDDLYRAIGRIPGTTSADVSARFNLRGGEEDEVLVLVDGAEIYDPFHVRDLYRAFSTIDAEAVGSVDVLSGGYPAEYGGRMSGVVDISTLAPTETKHEVGVSLLNTRLLSQGTFAQSRGAWMFSLRRGYLREVLALLEDTADINPRYYDLLGKVQWTLGERAVVSAHVMASRDRLTLDDGPGTTAHANYDDRYVWINLRKSWTDALFTQSVLSWGTMGRDRKGVFDNEFDLQRGQLEDHHQSTFVTLKNDATLNLSPRNLLKLGVTAKRVRARFDMEGSSVVPFAIFELGAPPREVVRSVHVRPSGNELNAYVADRVRLSESVVVEAGLRAGSESYTPDGVHFSPRINVAWTPTPRTSVRAAWGLFHQPQAIHELQVEDGVTAYQPAQRSEHRVVGIEHSFPRGFEARIELYDKKLTHLRPRYVNLYDHLLVFPELRADRIRVEPESGHARGAELLVRSDAAQPLSAWMSYTLARVIDTIDGREVPRDWDQRHAMTFSVNYQRGAKWNFNFAGTWHSGWPTTPVLARVEGTRILTELGPRASTRLPDYQRLDFRASRTAGAFSFFIELFNLLGHENVTRVNTFEFQQSAGGEVTAVPVTESVIGILPSFGVTWRF